MNLVAFLCIKSRLNFKRLQILPKLVCIRGLSYSKWIPKCNTDVDKDVVDNLFDNLIKGSRSHLARSITLIESVHPIKKQTGQAVLRMVMEHLRKTCNGRSSNSFRIGLSGPPGAGKSTFIESFGNFITSKSSKVAVLAVDPSSRTSGGSLMGDKTRMPELTLNPNAYIRPSPSGGNLGGVARNTNEAIVLCEGAGYDYILVETVGVGQSEFAVADMVDMFCLIIPPAGGDELQGLKRGIVEVADMVIVNKYDGDLMPAARRIASEYLSALKFIRKRHPDWRPKVVKVSSLLKTGFDELCSNISEFKEIQMKSNRIEHIRREQHLVWMWGNVKDQLMQYFEDDINVKLKLKNIETKVKDGLMSPGMAADMLIEAFQIKNHD